MDTVKIDSKNVKMIAHRGLSGLERENTCAAFVAAGNRSYYGIETDVHVTADGKFVVIHDETTERVSNGLFNVNVEESGYEDIKAVVLPDVDGSTHRTDIRIPLLADYIKICSKYSKKCILELKNEFKTEDIDELINEIQLTGYLENVVFISFSMKNCLNLRNRLKENEIQFLTSEEVTDELIKTLTDNKLELDIFYKRLTKEIADSLHDKGIKINVWTCDLPEDAINMVDMGVDYITTNILEKE